MAEIAFVPSELMLRRLLRSVNDERDASGLSPLLWAEFLELFARDRTSCLEAE